MHEDLESSRSTCDVFMAQGAEIGRSARIRALPAGLRSRVKWPSGFSRDGERATLDRKGSERVLRRSHLQFHKFHPNCEL